MVNLEGVGESLRFPFIVSADKNNGNIEADCTCLTLKYYIMKKFIFLLVAATMATTVSFAQNAKELAKEQYKADKILLKLMNVKPTSSAKKEARKYEKSHEKLFIIAGACQSNYEELIKAGANFASSPKRVNIHALDPAIIASSIALSDRSIPINLLEIIERTKYKEEGVGGIITSGTMYKGYPR